VFTHFVLERFIAFCGEDGEAKEAQAAAGQGSPNHPRARAHSRAVHLNVVTTHHVHPLSRSLFPIHSSLLSRFFAQEYRTSEYCTELLGSGKCNEVGWGGRTDGRTDTHTHTHAHAEQRRFAYLSFICFLVDVPLCSWLDMSCCDVLFSSLSGVDSRTPTPTLEAKWAEAEAGGCYVVTLSLQYAHLYMSFASESLPLRVNP
jgi:hypothetical protein